LDGLKESLKMKEQRSAKSNKESGKKVLQHIEIHPDRDKSGAAVTGAGVSVQVHRRAPDGWDSSVEEKHFGADEGPEALQHIAKVSGIKGDDVVETGGDIPEKKDA
jgi:hypothetical protein